MMAAERIEKVEDIAELGRKYGVRDDGTYWIFRAERTEQDLKSSLEEAFELYGVSKRDDKRKYEIEIVRAFQRKASLYLEHEPDKDDVLEWLALLRHWGGAARITDWTYSFYIAVYFALAENSKGRIWAFNAAHANKTEVIMKKIETHGDGDRVNKLTGEFEKKADVLGILREGDKLNDLAICCYCLSRDVKPVRFVYAVNPFRMNKRLTIQQGLFLMPGDITCSFSQNIDGNLDGDIMKNDILKEIVVAPAQDSGNNMLKELKYMNISQEVLFPDLGGFARSLKERLAYPEVFAHDRKPTIDGS
jgi:hypothetical protein